MKKTFGLLAGCLLLSAGCKPKNKAQSAESQTTGAASANYFVLVDSPETLRTLERTGYSFANVLPGTNGVALNNKELWEKSKPYQFVVETIRQDVKHRRARDPNLGPDQLYPHRSIDTDMLTSPEATYELIGVFNRPDLTIQQSNICTNVRLVYRLSYQHEHKGRMDGSRLPMTFIANFNVPLNGSLNCKEYLKSWQGRATADVLSMKGGPLSGAVVRLENFVDLELNYQIQTWPSSMAQAMGAFGEYVLRAFEIKSGVATQKYLRNTIDLQRLKAQPELAEELKLYLIANAAEVARGSATLPEKFLATSISSFTPGGTSRLSNRYFSQLFKVSDFASVDFHKVKHVSSAEEYMVRLNDMTCAGCHAGRSVNGFHYLGEERKNFTHRRNEVFVGFSEHLRVDLLRRKKVLAALVNGESTSSMANPISIKPPPSGAEYGSHCALDGHSGAGKKFEGWTCRSGLKCIQIDEPASEKYLGKCFPPALNRSGDPCRLGNTVENADATKESLKVTDARECGGVAQCSDIGGGFPNGMCRRGCGELDSKEACGPIAAEGFNECLMDPARTFVDCLENNSATNGRTRCGRNTPCRPDYFCAKAENSDQYGACVPSYFFFQLGMDAHPHLLKSGIGLRFGFKEWPGVSAMTVATTSTELILKRKPLQKLQLDATEFCSLPRGKSVGIKRRGEEIAGHVPVEVIYESVACPGFKGLLFVSAAQAKFM